MFVSRTPGPTTNPWARKYEKVSEEVYSVGPYSAQQCSFIGCGQIFPSRKSVVEHFLSEHAHPDRSGDTALKDAMTSMLKQYAQQNPDPVTQPTQSSSTLTFAERWGSSNILKNARGGGFDCPLCNEHIASVMSHATVGRHVLECKINTAAWMKDIPLGTGSQVHAPLDAAAAIAYIVATANRRSNSDLLLLDSVVAEPAEGKAYSGTGCPIWNHLDQRVIGLPSTAAQFSLTMAAALIDGLAALCSVPLDQAPWIPVTTVAITALPPAFPSARLAWVMEDFSSWLSVASLINGPATEDYFLSVQAAFREIASGLVVMHSVGIAAADLTPSHLVRCESSGKWKVALTPKMQVLLGDDSHFVTNRASIGLPSLFTPPEERKFLQWRFSSDIYVLGVSLAAAVSASVKELMLRQNRDCSDLSGILAARLRGDAAAARFLLQKRLIQVALSMINIAHDRRPSAEAVAASLHEDHDLNTTPTLARKVDGPSALAAPAYTSKRPWRAEELWSADQYAQVSLDAPGDADTPSFFDEAELLSACANAADALSPIFVSVEQDNDNVQVAIAPAQRLPVVQTPSSRQMYPIGLELDWSSRASVLLVDGRMTLKAMVFRAHSAVEHTVRVVPTNSMDFDETAMYVQLRSWPSHHNISRPVAVAQPEEAPVVPSPIAQVLDRSRFYAVYFPHFVPVTPRWRAALQKDAEKKTAVMQRAQRDISAALAHLHHWGLSGGVASWDRLAQSTEEDEDGPLRFLLVAPLQGFASFPPRDTSVESERSAFLELLAHNG